ncbi:MAG: signal recognition particle-docking protein FtsY [Acidobacteriota bacterium]
MDVLDRLRRSLSATRAMIGERLARSPAGIEPSVVEEALLAADVGLDTAEAVARDLGLATRKGQLPAGGAVEWLRSRVVEALSSGRVPVERGAPHVVLVVGVNGTGKTTTVAKLAAAELRAGEKVLLVAADTFRAAAIEQLQTWGARLDVPVVAQRPGADPGAVVFDALQSARVRGVSTVLVDTAGRLHTKHNLMAELDKVRKVCARAVPDAPHEVLLVIDASTGANGVVQAREFRSHGGATGVVLTKLDGTAKGGVVLAIAAELGLPVRWVGIGEGLDDLVPFEPAAFAAALLGGVS